MDRQDGWRLVQGKGSKDWKVERFGEDRYPFSLAISCRKGLESKMV